MILKTINSSEQQTSKTEMLLVFLLILVSSLSSRLTNSNYFFVPCFIFSVFAFIRSGLRIEKGIVLFTIGYALLTSIYLLKFGYIETLASLRFLVKIYFAYLILRITGVRFFGIFEKVVYYLTVISLIIFGAQMIVPEIVFQINDQLMQLFPILDDQEGFRNDSWIIFNFNNNGVDRNSGFMWEPGAFAAILTITMLISLTRSNFKITRPVIVFFVALITTFSTTGYIALGIVAAYMLLNINRKFWIIAIPVAMGAIIFIANLDFISKKIISQYESRYDVLNYAGDYGELDIVSLGRFGSMMADIEDYKKHFIIGIGLQNKEQTQSIYNELIHTNGLTIYMVMFGTLGLLLLIYNLSKTFDVFTSYYKAKGALLFTALILLVSFSNPVLVTPLFLAFQIGYLALNKPNRLIKQAL